MTHSRVFIHSATWPRQRLSSLLTAHDIDRSFLLMQAGNAALSISPNENIEHVRLGNLLVITSEDVEPWIGPIVTINADEANGSELEIQAISLHQMLHARPLSASVPYNRIGSGSIVRDLIARANAFADTGIYLPSQPDSGPSIDTADLGGQSVLDAFDELVERTDYEWWLTPLCTAQRIETTLHWGLRQGSDLSNIMHLWEGQHFERVEYLQDGQELRVAASTVGGLGPLDERPVVSYGGSLSGLTVQVNEKTRRRLLDSPTSLHNHQVLLQPTTTSLTDLNRRAQREVEKPLDSIESFSLRVNEHADWSMLGLGNFITVHVKTAQGHITRRVRITGIQPDEELGLMELVSEVQE